MTPPLSKKSGTKRTVKTAKKKSLAKDASVSSAPTPRSKKQPRFGHALSIEALTGLTNELQVLRQYPPVVKKEDGKYEGDILGFVRGLRLSARVLYFLREHLSSTGLEVSWGHLISDGNDSCSAECDIIVHEPGHVRRWNGFQNPIMSFTFVKARTAKIVVSCKSILTSIDTDYPKALKQHGIRHIFLFAECCKASQYEKLRTKAIQAGYAGVWCLYTTGDKDQSYIRTNDPMLVDFGENAIKAAGKSTPRARRRDERKLKTKPTR